MCLVDEKELERIVKTFDDLSALKRTANRIIQRLVDEGFTIRFENDPYEYPNLIAYEQRTL